MIKLSTALGNIGYPAKKEKDLKYQAALLAADTFGASEVREMPALINLAALRISLPEYLTVYEPTEDVLTLVENTDLRQMPERCPEFLEKPFLVETHDPTSPLFADISCIGGYWIDGSLFIIGESFPDGVVTARINPEWNGKEITGHDEGTLIFGEEEKVTELSVQAMRFLLVLSLLMEVEKSPVETKERKLSGKKYRNTAKNGWLIRNLYISRRYVSRNTEKKQADASSLEGKIPKQTEVRGYIRKQHYGEGNKKEKYIYVESFESRRWIIPAPRKIMIRR